MLIRAAQDQLDFGQMRLNDNDLFVTTGSTLVDWMTTVPDLVHDPRVEGGYAVVIDPNNPTGPSQRVDFPTQPGALVQVDVTEIDSTDELAAALREASTTEGPVLLQLTGLLAPAVLLPGFGAPEVLPGIIVDLDSLQYADTNADPSDRSARAEFLRALSASRATPLMRHQTRAIGLAALDVAS